MKKKMKKKPFTFKEAKVLLTSCAKTSIRPITEIGLCDRWVWDKYMGKAPSGRSLYNRVASGYNDPNKAEVKMWKDETHTETDFEGQKAKDLVRLGGCGLPKDHEIDPLKMF